MLSALLLFSVAVASSEALASAATLAATSAATLAATTAPAVADDETSEDYKDIPYVRPQAFKPCDFGELDQFIPGSVRSCAVQALQTAIPVSMIQQGIGIACKIFKQCYIFTKKGTIMPEDNSHHCLHGFMTQLRRTDVTGQAIVLTKSIIIRKGYRRLEVVKAIGAVIDCVDKAGFYLPLHKHQFLKMVELSLQILE